MTKNNIAIIDFGSQYTQLIARKVRELNVYAHIFPYNCKEDTIRKQNPSGIILSGSPRSINLTKLVPSFDVFSLNIPILGICYGMQFVTNHFGGKVNAYGHKEYGAAILEIVGTSKIFAGMSNNNVVWMSHGDSVTKLPVGFNLIGKSDGCPVAAIADENRQIYCVQFHPEVNHSVEGKILLTNFVINICKTDTSWNSSNFIVNNVEDIRRRLGNDKIICALSGGVDSTVLAVLLHKAVADQLICIHIDSGLMRTKESETIKRLFNENFDMNIKVINAKDDFFNSLKGIRDPERKRKIIGKLFIKLFEREAKEYKDCKWLAQGTLYPDVIESVSVNGPSDTIKSHHNVGGLPKRMNLKVFEPFRELFKDEVRKIGKELDIPDWFIQRHPFPGPGLGIRVLGTVTEEKVAILQKADNILLEELYNHNLYNCIWQAFAVLLPIQSVGVQGDERTYDYTCVIRTVNSVDGMTAEWFHIPYNVLGKISSRICNEVQGINRVCYDITNKPPGTIEWE